MDDTKFFSTKAGKLAVAFIIIMAAFAVIVAGIAVSQDMLCIAGFAVITAALLYSPVQVHILDRGKH